MMNLCWLLETVRRDVICSKRVEFYFSMRLSFTESRIPEFDPKSKFCDPGRRASAKSFAPCRALGSMHTHILESNGACKCDARGYRCGT